MRLRKNYKEVKREIDEKNKDNRVREGVGETERKEKEHSKKIQKRGEGSKTGTCERREDEMKTVKGRQRQERGGEKKRNKQEISEEGQGSITG